MGNRVCHSWKAVRKLPCQDVFYKQKDKHITRAQWWRDTFDPHTMDRQHYCWKLMAIQDD